MSGCEENLRRDGEISTDYSTASRGRSMAPPGAPLTLSTLQVDQNPAGSDMLPSPDTERNPLDRFGHAQSMFPVSPSSSRNSPAPEAQWRHRQAPQQLSSEASQQQHEPPTQQAGQQQSGPPGAATPTADGQSHWRQTYQKEEFDGSREASSSGPLSWQAAAHAGASSQPPSRSPPSRSSYRPDYQEIAAAAGQRRVERENEMTATVVQPRNPAWFGPGVQEQVGTPGYNEVATAMNQWRRSKEYTMPLEDGGPWQGGPGSSQTQHPKYRDIDPAGAPAQHSHGLTQEQLLAGPVLDAQLRTPESRAIETPSLQQGQPSANDVDLTPPALVTSWKVLPRLPDPTPPPAVSRKIPAPPANQWQRSREAQDLERAREVSQGAAPAVEEIPLVSRQGQGNSIDAVEPNTAVQFRHYQQQQLMLPLQSDSQSQQDQPQKQKKQQRKQIQGVQELPQRRQQQQQQQEEQQTQATNNQRQRGYRQEREPELQRQPPSERQRHTAASPPFMHYEDYTLFSANSSAKEELQPAGIRPSDTFSTMPDSAVRPHGQTPWGRLPEEKIHPTEARPNHVVPRRSCASEYILPWVPEMLWCILSILCLVIVAVLLRVYDGRALPDWPLGITLNALVAFFVTSCRVAFLVPIMEGLSQLKWNWFARGRRPLLDFVAFEEATRGPVGWFRLLFQARGRIPGVCAAVVLITGLLSSPLTQLTIEYPTQLVPTSTSVGVTVARRSEGFYFPSAGEASSGDLDIRYKRAIHQGIYHDANEPFPHVQPTCGSGECHWAPFDSLAVCASTKDISERLMVSEQTTPSKLGIDLGLDTHAPVRKASLPNGVFLVGGTDDYRVNISSAPGGDGYGFAPGRASLTFDQDADAASTALASIYIIYTHSTAEGPAAGEAFRAKEAMLRFCVNTYEISVSQGTADTRELGSETRLSRRTSDLPSSAPVTLLRARDDSSTKIYGISSDHAAVLSRYLESTFTGTYSTGGGGKTVRSTAASDALGAAMYEARALSGRTTEADTEGAAIENVMRNVATSLTNTIRDNGQSQDGVQLIPQSYVRVRWGWLAFLALQVFLVVMFLGSIAAQTAIWKVKVLKSSTIATLFAIGAEDKVLLERQNLGGINNMAEMKRQAEMLTGEFGEGDQGWVLEIARRSSSNGNSNRNNNSSNNDNNNNNSRN